MSSYSWTGYSGTVTLLLGILIWAQWPVSGLWVIGLFVGIDMIFAGTWLIMLALGARSLPSFTDQQGVAASQKAPVEKQHMGQRA